MYLRKIQPPVHTISFLFESDCIIPYSYLTYKSSDKSYQNFNISDNTFCRFVRYTPILHPLWKKFWHTHRTTDGPSCPQTYMRFGHSILPHPRQIPAHLVKGSFVNSA